MSHYLLSELSTPELVVDDIGTLFFYENRVLRAINANYVEHVNNLFDSGFISEIVEKEMFPNSWICSDSIEGYDLVIEHKTITPWNYPYEWSFTMFKDAGILVLELTKIANRYGLCVIDGHYYNVTFNKCQPTYIDLGSFRKNDNQAKGWVGYSDFYYSFYAPLRLWSQGLYTVSRNVSLGKTLFDQKEFIKINNPFLPNLLVNLVSSYTNLSHRVLETPQKNALAKLDNKKIHGFVYFIISTILNKMNKPATFLTKFAKLTPPKKVTMWTHYHTDHGLKDEKRFERIIEIIKSLNNCSSLVEVAANHGKLSIEISQQTQIKEVISTDYDETAVDKMYLLAKKTNTISPLVISASLPNGRISDAKVSKRIKSDVAVGLAITHHLVLTQGYSLESIFRLFNEIAYKYVIIEFMPLGLYNGILESTPPVPEYYTTAWFRDIFTSKFELIIDEKLEENRHVFVGRIIN